MVLEKRVSTGIKKLDKLMEGGFKFNSVNLVAGGPGCGKTIFAIQFLIEGVKKGEKGIYITFEETKEKLFSDMKSFGWDLEKYEKEKKLSVVEYSPERVRKIITEGGGTIEALISKMKATRLVIDSVSSFTMLYTDELSKKQASLALFELIRGWGCTALLTAEDATIGLDLVDDPGLEFEVDGIIILYHFKKKGKRYRALEILKMRGSDHPEITMEFDIKNNGVDVNPAKIVVQS